VIVLDTNQLERHSLNSSYMAILKVVSRLTNNKLALSEVTYNEHCAHFENQLRRALAQQDKAGAELMRLRIAAGHHKTARTTSNAQTSRLANR
jgi:hypothetical protein